MQRPELLILVLVAAVALPALLMMFASRLAQKQVARIPDEQFQYQMPIAQGFNGSLFSGERQMGDQNLYLSRASRCFSCDRDMANRYGSEAAVYAQPTSCFSCAPHLVKDNEYWQQARGLRPAVLF